MFRVHCLPVTQTSWLAVLVLSAEVVVNLYRWLLLPDARHSSPGEIKLHDALEALAHNMTVIAVGHHLSERSPWNEWLKN
jgi:thiamine pyrophosphate-dependent acetolactate synthase large subunit-like protein